MSTTSLLITFRAASSQLRVVPLSVLVVLLSIFVLGITILRGQQLTGWQAWAPLFVTVSGFLVSVVFTFNLYLHFILLGLWGISWLLAGYVILTHASNRERAHAP
jgi:TctA family transporter